MKGAGTTTGRVKWTKVNFWGWPKFFEWTHTFTTLTCTLYIHGWEYYPIVHVFIYIHVHVHSVCSEGYCNKVNTRVVGIGLRMEIQSTYCVSIYCTCNADVTSITIAITTSAPPPPRQCLRGARQRLQKCSNCEGLKNITWIYTQFYTTPPPWLPN